MYERATRVLAETASLRQALAEITAGAVGHLRLGTIEPTASLRVPPLLLEFRRERPKVRLTVEVGGTGDLAARVASGDLDAAICSPPPARLGLKFEPLFAETLALLVPTAHPLATRATILAADLAGQGLLLSEQACVYREVVERALVERGAEPYAGIEIGGQEACKRAVQCGLGPAILPAAAVSPPPAGTILREIADLALALPIGLTRPSGAGVPGSALEALLATLRRGLRVPTTA